VAPAPPSPQLAANKLLGNEKDEDKNSREGHNTKKASAVKAIVSIKER